MVSVSEKCRERCLEVPNICCNRSDRDRFLSVVSHLETWRGIIWWRWSSLNLPYFTLITSWEFGESTNLTGFFFVSVRTIWPEGWILLMKIKWWRLHFLRWQFFISNGSNDIAWVIECPVVELLSTFLLSCIRIERMLLQL